jgi:NAD(P)-dependent dehydrogenase (short-subunit alcohol dehydrogenase family)
MTDALFPNGAVLVVGGSGGIARHICKEFAKAGTDVALTYYSKRDVADEVVADIKKLGRKAAAYALDVSDAKAVGAVIDKVAADMGRIHTVVYGAAPLTHQLFISELTPAHWQKAMDQESNGFFRVVQATLMKMRGWGGGSYVTLGSAGDMRWPDKDVLSVVPKAANESLVRGLAVEEGRYGIRANSVLIGVIEAGMFLELTKQGAFPPAWVEETQKMLAIKRWGRPEEIGHAAVFLASSKAAYITGQQIAVAGGFGV